MPSIANQSILILGGTSGIGFAVAELALSQSVHVTIASSNPTRLSTALSKLRTSFPNAQISVQECDLLAADPEAALLSLFNAATSNGEKLLDHIIYTAVGKINMTPLAQMSAADIQKTGHFHSLVPILIGKLAARFLNPGYRSSIIFTSGQIAEKPMKGWTVQAAYATGLLGITRALALDYAPIRVNCVAPGATNTELWGTEAERGQRAEMMKGMMLLGKVGEPEEVAEAYGYLMRNWNASGSIVSSNGGTVLK